MLVFFLSFGKKIDFYVEAIGFLYSLQYCLVKDQFVIISTIYKKLGI